MCDVNAIKRFSLHIKQLQDLRKKYRIINFISPVDLGKIMINIYNILYIGR